jgi:protein TonB
MGQPASLLAPTSIAPAYPRPAPAPRSDFAFRSLGVLTERRSLRAGRGVTLAASMVVHVALLAAVILVPLAFFEEALPGAELAVRAFFAAPAELAPPPPPPPPPPASVRSRAIVKPVPAPSAPARFVAPVEVPEQMPVAEGIDVGVEGGVPGGVEGGVPGGVVGGIIGGLPTEAPAPAGPVVRIGGNVRAPKLMHEVKPEYPPLAVASRVSAVVIMEAHVGTDGRVLSVRVLRGHPILDDAAVAAVKQRRYQPLLLNGVPTEFILTMTMTFRLTAPAPGF